MGGKRRLLPVLIESLPKDFGQMDTYVEPFVGGGAPLLLNKTSLSGNPLRHQRLQRGSDQCLPRHQGIPGAAY
ncbi:DNA adenine methylase [Bacteroides ovatus]|nr:DNA adenine methylase [Bacteroides ovatus]